LRYWGVNLRIFFDLEPLANLTITEGLAFTVLDLKQGEIVTLPNLLFEGGILQGWQVDGAGEILKQGSRFTVNRDTTFQPSVHLRLVTIQPGVGMLALFSSMNYKPWFALGEMVDNSIQSFVENERLLRKTDGPNYKLKVEITFDQSEGGVIRVSDNAAGIYAKDVPRAFTPAVRRQDLSGIGQFGIGMKSSATWYSNNYTITTKALGESLSRSVHFDIPQIIESDSLHLPIQETPQPLDSHGTTITMRALHRGLPTGQTLGRIRSYIASIYRDYLRSGRVEIRVGGQKLEYSDPVLLTEPYWPTDEGRGVLPDTLAIEGEPEEIYWREPISITLEDSWSLDTAPTRPINPPTISGWVGILQNGTTKTSGLALIWRGKVVVGAGSAAQGDEDSYRPNSIFGTTNTYAFQRLVGELNVSQLAVTAYKDNIVWRPGQEEELQKKVRRFLDEQHFMKMMRNYRSTQGGPEIQNSVSKSVQETAVASTNALIASLDKNWFPAGKELEDLFQSEKSEGDLEARYLIYRDSGTGNSYFLQVSKVDNSEELISLVQSKSDELIILVNRKHRFMESFANLPGADLDPILRMCVAAALTQIKLQNLEVEGWHFVLPYMNKYLSSWLAHRMGMVAPNE
jgi:hypothetical protein